MNIILFDDPAIKAHLLPLTYLRPTAEIRVGILKISEKWMKYSSSPVSFLVDDYLKHNFNANIEDRNILINGAAIPDQKLWDEISNLRPGGGLYQGDTLIAANVDHIAIAQFNGSLTLDRTITAASVLLIDRVWKVFQENGDQIRKDFSLVTKGRKSEPVTDPHTIIYGKENLFLEEGVDIKAAIINAEEGPIYIGKNARIMESAILHGPVAVGEGTHVNLNAKVRHNTTLGPFCRAGGEINNVVMFGNSNKGHEGFLGNAVIGEWCNIGADTNNSNLKNNYSEVKMWNYPKRGFIKTGTQFCGLIMGDHTKCGINTMFNTGTVIGIGANIYGAGFPRNFIPSFSWGGASGFKSYRIDAFFEAANKMMERRNIQLTDDDKAILSHIFEVSSEFRNF